MTNDTKQPSAVRSRPSSIEEFIDGYTYRSDNGDYVPNEWTRALLIDALHGWEFQRIGKEAKQRARAETGTAVAWVDPKYLPKSRVGHTNVHMTLEKRDTQTLPLYTAPQDQQAEIARLRAALEWYAEHVRDCRKITSVGDKARNALDNDGGKRANAALASAPTQGELR